MNKIKSSMSLYNWISLSFTVLIILLALSIGISARLRRLHGTTFPRPMPGRLSGRAFARRNETMVASPAGNRNHLNNRTHELIQSNRHYELHPHQTHPNQIIDCRGRPGTDQLSNRPVHPIPRDWRMRVGPVHQGGGRGLPS